MLSSRNCRIFKAAVLVSFGVFMAGCKTDAYYMTPQAPPASDPAQLHDAMAKLDGVYHTNFGDKYAAPLAQSELAASVALSRGDAGTAFSQVQQDRKLYEDAAQAAKATVTVLSGNTVIVNTTDHDDYANFYTAEADRLNSKATEYNALLALKPTASKGEIDTLNTDIADAKIKEDAAVKTLAAKTPKA